MKFYARVEVTKKPEIPDPEADTTLKTLGDLGYSKVNSVRRSTVYHIRLEAPNEDEARKLLEKIAIRPLANTVMEKYEITLEKEV